MALGESPTPCERGGMMSMLAPEQAGGKIWEMIMGCLPETAQAGSTRGRDNTTFTNNYENPF
ncbi:hypothetical protein JZ751_020749 [Albula glossodonta]|uniref:Uncharacterized protein n=1 Tax=Albula glossodonta TaxID=121402 RepID=A0A8T2PKG7_9TELE|nr:hypothetical protein JZ751_020749 [Albula glossodonta]